MAGFVLVAALLATGESIVRVRWPFQMDYGEGIILYSAERLNQGLPLYPDPRAYPTVLNPYGPVGYFLVAACVRLGGLTFLYPRLLMLGCGLLVALLLALLIEHWTHNWALAWAFGLFFLTTRATLLWWPLLRVDLLAIALSLAGFLVWLRSPRRCWPLAVLLFALALYVKPTALPAPGACLLSLAAEKEWKRACAFAGLLGGLCLLGLVCMQRWSGGNFFFHVFRSHPDQYTFDNLLHLFAVAQLGLVSLALFVGTFCFTREKATRPAMFYLVCSFGVAMVTAGKIGSSINHILEPLAAWCIAGGLGCRWLIERQPRPRFLPILGCFCGALTVYQVMLFAGSPTESDFRYEACTDLYSAVRESPAKNILSENVGALVLAGKPVLLAEPFLLNQMVQHGLLSGEQMERRVNNREFDLMVLDSDPQTLRTDGSDRWWPRLADAFARNYYAVARFDCKDGNVMLEPRESSPVVGNTGRSEARGGVLH